MVLAINSENQINYDANRLGFQQIIENTTTKENRCLQKLE
jgi:hypothetical protein